MTRLLTRTLLRYRRRFLSTLPLPPQLFHLVFHFSLCLPSIVVFNKLHDGEMLFWLACRWLQSKRLKRGRRNCPRNAQVAVFLITCESGLGFVSHISSVHSSISGVLYLSARTTACYLLR